MLGSIALYSEVMGKAPVEYAVKVINGEEVPTDILIKIELITEEKLGS